MKLHLRGNPNRTGDEVPRRFLAILSNAEPGAFSQGSGRLELARAIASPDNPLTRPRHRQSPLAAAFRPRDGRHAQQFRRRWANGPRIPSLLDYLARRLIDAGLVAEGHAPRDSALGDVSAVERRRSGELLTSTPTIGCCGG